MIVYTKHNEKSILTFRTQSQLPQDADTSSLGCKSHISHDRINIWCKPNPLLPQDTDKSSLEAIPTFS